MIMQDDQFKSWQSLNWVAFVQPPSAGAAAEAPQEEEEAPSTEDALSKVTLREASVMIAGCSDPDLLAAWYEKDKRAGVKRAVEARLQSLGLLDSEEDESDQE
jgi:hypothetical protein